MRLALFAIVAMLAPHEEFTNALNQERGNRGLRPVVYDSRLDPIAAANNVEQVARGSGHWITGGYGQCSYVGPVRSIDALYGAFRPGAVISWCGVGYLDSPKHAAILLHPSARRIGIDQDGNRNTVVIAFD